MKFAMNITNAVLVSLAIYSLSIAYKLPTYQKEVGILLGVINIAGQEHERYITLPSIAKESSDRAYYRKKI